MLAPTRVLTWATDEAVVPEIQALSGFASHSRYTTTIAYLIVMDGKRELD